MRLTLSPLLSPHLLDPDLSLPKEPVRDMSRLLIRNWHFVATINAIVVCLLRDKIIEEARILSDALEIPSIQVNPEMFVLSLSSTKLQGRPTAYRGFSARHMTLSPNTTDNLLSNVIKTILKPNLLLLFTGQNNVKRSNLEIMQIISKIPTIMRVALYKNSFEEFCDHSEWEKKVTVEEFEKL